MTEVSLFIMIGAVAVAAAVLMLLSENAVHSTLFLIINFGCVAFLFLMLDAPFLAMIQIAVYAGAIMVLFLFVIMLLGAEQTTDAGPRFRWLTPVALFLSVLFLVTAGSALTSGQVDLFQSTGTPPILRVIHGAPDAPAFDVFVDGELLAENVAFGETSTYETLTAGEFTVGLAPAGRGAGSIIATLPLTMEDSSSGYSVVAYGEGLLPSLVLVRDDLTSTPARSGRVTFVNAYSVNESLNLVDLGPNRELNVDATTGAITDPVLASAVAEGASTEALVLPEGQHTLAIVDQQNNIVLRLREFEVPRETSQTMVLVGERLFDDTLRPALLPLMNAALPSFGGPEAIGQLLFTRYLLPFEMVAVLLLAAMIGAIVLTRQDDPEPRRRLSGRRKVSRPLTSVIAAQTGHEVTQLEESGQAQSIPAESAQTEPAGD